MPSFSPIYYGSGSAPKQLRLELFAPWRARVRHEGRDHLLGRFSSFEEAEEAERRWRCRH